MKRRDFLKISGTAGLITIISPSGIAQILKPRNALSNLENSFLNPPNTSKVGNMWMWMNGHVSKQGITLDLEAMQRAGIGSIFNFDAGTGIPQGPVKYLSTEWLQLKEHTINECRRLGLEFCMHNCPGWSSSGGPWITPELSMKKIVFSEINIEGDAIMNIKLAQPETVLNFYKDIAVVAYPALAKNTIKFNDWKKKTNQEFNGDGTSPIENTNNTVSLNSIIDVTKKVNQKGELNWKAPEGSWTVLRIGFTSNGKQNVSAPDTGIGLECDKYSTAAITFHFNKMFEQLLPAMAPLTKTGSMGLEIDSFEVGMQNWTDGFETEFEKRNGYNIIPFLIAMNGYVVGDADKTDCFLWDVRRTQADLLADNYYGTFAALCKKNNIVTFFEPYDRGPMEEIQIGSRADAVMGEYWNGLSTIFQNNLTMRRTPKLASSIAHINGQKIIGIEGLTGEASQAKWQEYAFAMKPICDKIFTMGINRLLIHRNAHQPHPTAAPGMTMGPWGIQFDRTNTLWNVNAAWLKYLSRCQAMLQQGIFIADFAYFSGEDAGVYTKINRDDLNPKPIAGYDYDMINAETLLQKAIVVNNKLVLKSGMSYTILVLQQYKTISLQLLKKISQLVKQGLIIVGAKPLTSPGLKTQSQQEINEFNLITNQLWGNVNDTITDKKVGFGRVFWGQPFSEILQTIKLSTDFTVTNKSGNATTKYIHRKEKEIDFYFVSNQNRLTEEVVCSCRMQGKIPELWDAYTGKIITAPVYEEIEGRINVALTLASYASVFIVFKNKITPHTNAVQSILKDGVEIISTKPAMSKLQNSNNELVNNFTIGFWAKPELEIMISTEAWYEGVKNPWTDFYAIYPNAGEKLYGKNHAISGVTVGRNGIAIWENENGIPKFNIAAPAAIAGWSYITIVYENAVPSIYVNGKFIKKGDKNFKFIHPQQTNISIEEGASFYNGDMQTPVISNKVLSPSEINSLVNKLRGYTAVNNAVTFNAIKNLNNKNESVLIWQNANYAFISKNKKVHKINVSNIKNPAEVKGEWEVLFPKDSGAPDKINLHQLISLKNYTDDGVKYFSGTATYKNTFDINAIEKDKNYFIDLGSVEVIAEVMVNRKNLGIYWVRPFLINISEVIKQGVNQLEINVTNQWVNRLIGDEQLPEVDKYVNVSEGNIFQKFNNGAIEQLPNWYLNAEPKPENGRVAFSTWKHFQKDSPLLESGLIGPVIILEAVSAEILTQ
jgi:hypothetical protein